VLIVNVANNGLLLLGDLALTVFISKIDRTVNEQKICPPDLYILFIVSLRFIKMHKVHKDTA